MALTFSMPTEWSLAPSSTILQMAWEQSQAVSFHGQSIYLNSLCLNSFLPWFQAEYDSTAQAWLPSEEQQFLWGVVTGSAIQLGANHGSKRIVLLPTETSDTSQLEIPQEWIDIPSWAADYFLAVQVDSEGEWLLVWGYVTHEQVKSTGNYDANNRTYLASLQEITPDLNAFWETVQRCPNAVLKGEITSLSALETVQSQQLIQRLGNPDLAFPRLAVPFRQWGALLNQPTDRRNLARQRSGQALAVINQLKQWFQAQVIEGWELLEGSLGNDRARLATNFRRNLDEAIPTVQRVKQFHLNTANSTESVQLLLRITTEADARIGIIVQLHPGPEQNYLLEGIELSLISAQGGDPIQSITSNTSNNYIQLTRFRCPSGTQFQISVKFNDHEIIEPFVA